MGQISNHKALTLKILAGGFAISGRISILEVEYDIRVGDIHLAQESVHHTLRVSFQWHLSDS